MTLARVGIIMRTYERPQMLRRAISGVASQEFGDWHLVVVNNGGDPGTVRRTVQSAVEANPEISSRIDVIDTGARLGMEAASNIGLARSRAEFFVIHDDDDTWETEFLATCVSHLDDHPDCAGVVTAVTRVWERATAGRLETVRKHSFRIEAGWLEYDRLVAYNVFPPIAALFRREVYDEVGPYDESLPVLGDWEFNMRVVERHRLCFLGRPLANYHARTPDSDAGTQSTITAAEDLHREMQETLRRRWDSEPALGHPGMSKGELSRVVHRRILDADAAAQRRRRVPPPARGRAVRAVRRIGGRLVRRVRRG